MFSNRFLLSMALLVQVILLLGFIYSLISGDISMKDFYGLFISTITSIVGVAGKIDEQKSKASKQKNTQPSKDASVVEKSFRLPPTFTNGLYGGLIGGSLAGIIVGLTYYFASRAEYYDISWERIALVVLHASFTGTIGGAFIQFTINWFRHLVKTKHFSSFILNEISGGILGGAVGGILPGILGGALFWSLSGPFVDIGLIMTAALLGTIFLVLGVLLYDFKGRRRNIFLAFVITVVIFVFLFMLNMIILAPRADQFFELFIDYGGFLAGAILGLTVGIILGLLVGLSLWIYRLLQSITQPIKN